MIKINLKNKYNFENIESGTMAILRAGDYAYPVIVLKDIDGDNPIVFDLEEGNYYKDIQNYEIFSIIENYEISEI